MADPSAERVDVAVLVSGGGSNLQALLDAQAQGQLAPAHIAVVVSNRPGVRALERAALAGCEAVVVDHTGFGSRQEFERALLEVLRAHAVQWVVLAGFMRILGPDFVAQFPDRIVNTHPSLLPAFPGARAPAQAIAHGVKLSGVTVHFVDDSLDGGAIIAQRTVPVLPGDDAATLHHRIQREEHRLLPEVVRALGQGRISRVGRAVHVAGAPLASP
jgi:phosphoribosylglycinamide formyltransferase-1